MEKIPKPGGCGQHKVGSSVGLSSFALDCQHCLEFGVLWSEEIMLTLCVQNYPQIFGQNFWV